MKDHDYYAHVFNAQPREEMKKNLRKKIDKIFKGKKKIKEDPSVKELIKMVDNLAHCFDKVTIYAFDATELRDFHRKEAGII